MLDDENGNPAGKQLMVLWSTKDNPLVEVNGHPWTPVGRPGFDDDGGGGKGKKGGAGGRKGGGKMKGGDISYNGAT